MDLLCAIHELNQRGQISGTADQLSRLCRCSVAQFVDATNEIRHTSTADISEREGVFTIVCRRLKRQAHITNVRSKAAFSRWGKVAYAKPDTNGVQNTEDEHDYDREIESTPEGGKEGVQGKPSGDASGAPCSIADCVNHGHTIGLPANEAEAFWNYYAGKGWQAGGDPVRAWKPLLANWRTKWEARRSIGAVEANRKESIWEKKQRIEMITEEVDQIRRRGCTDGQGGYVIGPKEKDRYYTLIKERKKLKEEIKGV